MKTNKKAMMDDLFDFLFTIVVAFFALLFVGLALNSGVDQANEKSLEKVADFKRLDSAVNNLRVQFAQGTKLDLTNLEKQISQSKVLAGKTITSCEDYQEKTNCQTDAAKIGSQCKWNKKKKKCS